MKTAKEWWNYYYEHTNGDVPTTDFIKKVQEDAFKAGMEKAAEICHNSIQSQSWYFKTLIEGKI